MTSSDGDDGRQPEIEKPVLSRFLSRRRFLQRAGVGIAFAGRSAITLADSGSQRDVAERPQLRLGDEFVYGTQFYYPRADPRPDQFRSLMESVKNRHGFNIIRIFPPWDYYNPRPGQFVFDDLEQLLSICDEYDVGVLMTVMLESAPYWLEQAHPETRFVNANGQPLHLEGSGAHYTGGSPGLCFDWDVVRDAAALFMRELVRISARHRSLYAYDIWNEPSSYVDLQGPELWTSPPGAEKLFCYCDRSIAKFRQWVQRRYENLDRLNEAWNRRYPDWEAIDPPRHVMQTYADWFDWRHFLEENTTECLKFRRDVVRKADSVHVIETHVALAIPTEPATLRGIQPWRLAELVDVFGCSFYPNMFGWPIDQAASQIESVRSNAGGKDFWITEMEANGLPGKPLPPREIRVWNWLAVAAGARGIIYFGYLTEGTGPEASMLGLVERNGTPTVRVEEAARTNRLIQARWSLLKKYRPKPQVAILFDQDNAKLAFAESGKEDASVEAAAGYYKALWNLDHWVDFIEPLRIDNALYGVLVVPCHLIGKDKTCDAIREFAERGGTVILESGFCRFDEGYFFNAVIPGGGLDEAFGYREREGFLIQNGKLPLEAFDQAPSRPDQYEVEIEVREPLSVRLKPHTRLTPIEIISAKPIATCQKWTIGAMKEVGKGRVYYFGTSLGRSILAGDSGGIALMRSIIDPVVKTSTTSTGRLRPRLIEGSGRALLTVFNYSEADEEAVVTVPAPYSSATDVYGGKRHRIENGRFQIGIPFRDVGVFDLE